jgi:endogenous inhibitor of DNA gyrase (YacG/DUF329 family)
MEEKSRLPGCLHFGFRPLGFFSPRCRAVAARSDLGFWFSAEKSVPEAKAAAIFLT